MILLFLESLGTTELLVILVLALVLFGPRKLPEMTRKFGKSLNDFKRAGDDFKRTWEREVALESVEREAAIDRAMVAEPEAAGQLTADDQGTSAPEAAHDITAAAFAPVQGANIARGAHVETPAPTTTDAAPEIEATEATEATTGEQPSRKTDWL
ncbi:MAG TPA: twin-arginine translocase TatA/TatE family subunit [Pyrinomonadaceae bacterium]|jgi:TatA/E family protein of Tat protein translocase